MKRGAIGIGVFVLMVAAAFAGMLWVSAQKRVEPPPESEAAANTGADASKEETTPIPVISKTGPWPKVSIEQSEFQFGSMGVGEKRSHTFVVKNTGEAPLKLVAGSTTCKCTLSKLKNDEIAVGDDAEITLTWEAKDVVPMFRQTARIHSNDPKNATFDLVISGEVLESFTVLPPDNWTLGEIVDEKTTSIGGMIFSKVFDKFEIASLESSTDLMTVESSPMTAEELTKQNAKSGYNLKATIKPEMAVGSFVFTLKVKLKAEKDPEFSIRVVGFRSGPLQFLPAPGITWRPEVMAVDLGEFDSQVGKKAKLILFVSGMDEEFQFTKVESDTPFLKVSLRKDPDFKAEGRQKFDVHFEVPPGSPAATLIRKSSARITIQTNHPKAKEIVMRAELVSF